MFMYMWLCPCRWQQPSVPVPGPQCSLPPHRGPDPAVHRHHHHLCSVRQLGGTRTLLVSAHRYRREVSSHTLSLFINDSSEEFRGFCAAVQPIVIKWAGPGKLSIPCHGAPMWFLRLTDVSCILGFPVLTTVPASVTCSPCRRAAIVLSLSESTCGPSLFHW